MCKNQATYLETMYAQCIHEQKLRKRFDIDDSAGREKINAPALQGAMRTQRAHRYEGAHRSNLLRLLSSNEMLLLNIDRITMYLNDYFHIYRVFIKYCVFS